MELKTRNVSEMSESEKNKLLIKDGWLFFIIAGIFLIAGFLLIIGKAGVLCLIGFVPMAFFVFMGIRKIFMKKENKDRLITSKLVNQAIKNEKKSGHKLSSEDIDKIKFELDPIFHDKVVANVHAAQDKEYNEKVQAAKQNVKNMEQARINEIARIDATRWNSLNGYMQYNLIEGKVRISGEAYLFSSIRGAEVTRSESYRIVTTETGKSKRHVSVGKAVVGGALLGPIGAIAGGTMGKTTHRSQSTSNAIPICSHLGVLVDIDGFKKEVIILNTTVDQTSKAYEQALKDTELIMNWMQKLSQQPVPSDYTEVEMEPSVLEWGKKIAIADKELQRIIQDKPKYEIPERYLK